MRSAFLLAGLLAFPLGPAAAAERYANARFGFSIEIPAGFGRPREADNGDGVTVRAPDGNAVLLAYGANALGGTFPSEAADAIAGDRGEGWNLSFRKVGAAAASWSGTKGGRILFVRAVPLCDGAVGTFRLEYDGSAKRRYDPVVRGLVGSFRAAPCD